MELSIFLAKLLGIYLLVLAGIWLIRKDQLDLTFREISLSRTMIFFSGLITLIAGLAIALGHSIWQANWRGLITLLGYLMIVQGIIRMGFTDLMMKQLSRLMNKAYWIIITVLIILGGFLTYSGFVAG